jgi:hypothetical protein
VVALGLAALLALAVPVSRSLTVRISLTGTLVLGWLPTLWWWRIPWVSGHQMTLALGVTAGALAGWCVAGARPVERLRRCWPRLRWIDAAPLGAAVAGAIALWPLLAVSSPARALIVGLQGYDHASHFAMFEMISEFGTITGEAAPPATGGAWYHGNYPQNYHVLLAAGAQLWAGAGDASPERRMVLYIRLVVALTVVVVAVLVAAICAVGGLRRRPALAVLAGACVVSVYVMGTGTAMTRLGFPNFVFACAMVPLAAIVGLRVRRGRLVLPLIAVAGCVSASANSWLPLAIPCAITALAVVAPIAWARWRRMRGRWVVVGVAVALGVAGVARAWEIAPNMDPGAFLAIGSAWVHPRPRTAMPALALTIAAMLWAAWRRGGRVRRRRGPGVWTLATPVVATGLLAAAVYSMAGVVVENGMVRDEGAYYFVKIIAGTEMLTIPLALAAISLGLGRGSQGAGGAGVGRVGDPGQVADTGPSTGAGRRAASRALAACGVAACAAGIFTAYGVPWASGAGQLGQAPAPLGEWRRDAQSDQTVDADRAAPLLEAAALQRAEPEARALWYPRDEAIRQRCGEALWVRALSRTMTVDLYKPLSPCDVYQRVWEGQAWTAAGAELLSMWDGAVLIVERADAKAELEAELGDGVAGRVWVAEP